MARLVLMLPASTDMTSAPCALVGDDGVLAEASLALGHALEWPANVEIDDAVAILPSEAVFARRLEVPGQSERDAQRAAPFLIEEQLAEPIEQVRVTIGPRLEDGTRWVFAINTALCEHWQRMALSLGVKPVFGVPDAFMLETFGADLGAFAYGDRVLFTLANTGDGETRDLDVQARETRFGVIDRDLASIVLPALAERAQPRRVLISDDLDPNWAAPDQTPIALKRVPAPDLTVRAGQIARDELDRLPVSLGQALLSNIDVLAWLRPWRAAAVLALAACLGLTALSVGQAVYYEARTDLYRDAEIEAFQANFPEITRVVNVQAQLRQQIVALGGGSGQGGFLELSSALAAILGDTSAVQLESLRYDSERGALAVTARYADFGDFETLQSAAQAQGVVIDDGGARQSDDGVVGDFTVRLP